MPDRSIIIAAGGTGGHIYPGIALAKELRIKGFTPLFFVRRGDIGKEILEREGFKYFEIPAMGLPRGLGLKLIKFPFVMIYGLMAAFLTIKRIKPRVVAGLGGYVSFPAVVCAKLLGIPSIIHEQNAIPGLTNRILSGFADAVALSFDESKKYFPGKKTLAVGNPVRPELFKTPDNETYEKMGLTAGKFTVLVFGGSQGAVAINRAVIDSFEYLSKIKDKIQFLNITGQKDYELTKKDYLVRNIQGNVMAYTHDMGAAYAVSDLIICRSGASTVSELKILNKQAVLIPFPYAVSNHQEYNARALEKEGIAKVVLEKDLAPGMLAGIVINAFHSTRTGRRFNIPPVFPQELLAGEMVKLMRGEAPVLNQGAK
jgi:UDP-N-acetylglucosamine--N-acetylmuramyl-(pentapeptide) pyrophosphoryl-undecaprenol N-acetylglucosamine transferase